MIPGNIPQRKIKKAISLLADGFCLPKKVLCFLILVLEFLYPAGRVDKQLLAREKGM
jgi:hypothetical protein